MQSRIGPLFRLFSALCAAACALPAAAASSAQLQDWQRQVRAAECSFAASMARRDPAAFAGHLSAQALFFGGAGEVLSGSAAVLAGWRAYFEGAAAPFSWEPDQVVANEDGSLAHSTGLVRNPQGEPIARFNSVWRQESPGQWRIVVDKGGPLSPADRNAPPAGAGCAEAQKRVP